MEAINRTYTEVAPTTSNVEFEKILTAGGKFQERNEAQSEKRRDRAVEQITDGFIIRKEEGRNVRERNKVIEVAELKTKAEEIGLDLGQLFNNVEAIEDGEVRGIAKLSLANFYRKVAKTLF